MTHNKWPRYIMIIFLLIVYINRGLFIASPETETFPHGVSEKQEINSAIELLIELATGKHNDTDEDENSPEAYNTFKIVQPFIFEVFSQSLELWDEFSDSAKKISYPFSEKIPKLIVYGQIDHPPQILI